MRFLGTTGGPKVPNRHAPVGLGVGGMGAKRPMSTSRQSMTGIRRAWVQLVLPLSLPASCGPHCTGAWAPDCAYPECVTERIAATGQGGAGPAREARLDLSIGHIST